jgi:hypothetical protein
VAVSNLAGFSSTENHPFQAAFVCDGDHLQSFANDKQSTGNILKVIFEEIE